jgi:hypothetical protein
MGSPLPGPAATGWVAPPERRRRRRRRALVLLLAACLMLGGGVVAVVALLGVLDGSGPIVQRCEAELTPGVRPSLAPDQTDNAALLTAMAVHRELPARAATIAIATAAQESKLRNIDYGDRDSLGLFQQRPSQGWGTPEEVMDPVYATNAFYDVLVSIEGYEDLPVTDAAQRVQRSAFPDAYAGHERMARAFASALTGYTPASLICRLDAASEEERAGAADAVTARLARDFVDVTVTRREDGAVLVEAGSVTGTSDEDERVRLGWAVANWAVATAHATGISEVITDGAGWDRADGRRATWTPVEGDEGLTAGEVLIR